MQIKCDKCDKPATIHLTNIVDGKKNEVHLCEDCAAAEGLTVKASVPLGQACLEEFVLQKSPAQEPEAKCDACGMTFSEFRRKGLLGLPQRLRRVFRAALEPLLERAHGPSTQHIGRVPSQAGSDQQKQTAILPLQGAAVGRRRRGLRTRRQAPQPDQGA